jgi:hypothetical protein
LVALAGTGGTPVNNSAGNATKLPPPATALIAPPRAPAKNRNMALCKFKQTFYHDSRSPLQRRFSASPLFTPRPNSEPRPHKVPLSHFLTTRAGPYMNGAIYRPSATECLTRTLCGSQGGFKRKESQLRQKCVLRPLGRAFVCARPALQAVIQQEEAWPVRQT